MTRIIKIDKLKIRTIKMVFPLHKEGLTSFLSPILGQYAIKNSEFISQFLLDFNKSTNNIFSDYLNLVSAEAGGALYDEQVYVPLRVSVYKAGKFSVTINTPELGLLFSQLFAKRRRILKKLKTGNILILRSYKKLFQLTSFKQNTVQHDFSDRKINVIKNYNTIRNALFHRK